MLTDLKVKDKSVCWAGERDGFQGEKVEYGCCCKCKFHFRLTRQCTVDDGLAKSGCVCDEQLAWLCAGYALTEEGTDRINLMSEHGLCEIFTEKTSKQTLTGEN